MLDPLRFRCTGCGNCCRLLRVAITVRDLQRLVVATGQPASALVEWLAPDAVDMTGEPESFVELSSGRRLLVLAQQQGACVLLGSNDRCTAYAARPRDCRAYPFDITRRRDESGKRHLDLLPLENCDCADDGANDAATLELEDDARYDELVEYQSQVANWNRAAKLRRRLGKHVGTGEAFLASVISALPSR